MDKMNLTYEETKTFQTEYDLVPLCREIYADVITPINLLKKLSMLDQNFFLLESVEGGEQWGRYSFLGYQPLMHITCKSGETRIKSGETERRKTGRPMEILRELLSGYRAPRIEGLPTFTGGFVGYFSYEMIAYAEPKLKIKDSGFQDLDLMLFDKVIAFDHLRQKICVIVNAKLKDQEQGYRRAALEIDQLIHMICGPMPAEKPKEPEPDIPRFICNTSRNDYLQMVEKTKHYIREGDIFQGVISRKFTADYRGSLLNMYRVLRTTNPSPYMYFIQSGSLQIAGASPETLIKLVDNKLTTFPVAGTRPRGKKFCCF